MLRDKCHATELQNEFPGSVLLGCTFRATLTTNAGNRTSAMAWTALPLTPYAARKVPSAEERRPVSDKLFPLRCNWGPLFGETPTPGKAPSTGYAARGAS